MRITTFISQSPLYEVTRLARLFDGSLPRLLRSDDLSFFESLVLAAIRLEEPNPVKPSRLAEAFSTTRGNVSHCISSLEAKGLVQRQIDADDARGFRLALKPQGRTRAMQAIRTLDQMQRLFEKEIGAAELTRALNVIRKVEALCSAGGRQTQKSR
jgi:DNA-binding MarR family transcriptional regulator